MDTYELHELSCEIEHDGDYAPDVEYTPRWLPEPMTDTDRAELEAWLDLVNAGAVVCPDCGEPVTAHIQPATRRHPAAIIGSCFTPVCTLNGTTKSAAWWTSATEAERDLYRKAVRQLKSDVA